MSQAFQQLAAKFASQAGLDPHIFVTQIKQESGFNPNAESGAGAVGIAQIVPKYHPDVNPRDPVASLKWAAHYMKSLVDKYGNYQDALSVYNSGRPWAVGQGIGETHNYVTSILGNAKSAKLPSMTVPSVSVAPLNLNIKEPASTPNFSAFLDTNLARIGQGSYSPSGALSDLLNTVQGAKSEPTTLTMSNLNSLFPPVVPVTSSPKGMGGKPSDAALTNFNNGDKYPLGTHGKLIGVPYQGSHKPGATTPANWQSDNAVDISIPKGTPVYAVSNGTIGSNIGSFNSASPYLQGQRLTVQGPANAFYYAHLSRIVVKAGQKVKAGQLLGYSGVANGVAHLHFAVQSGDPRRFTGT